MKDFWIISISTLFLICVKLSHCQNASLTFPENFLIGAATASYQIEGAWNVSDKSENTWDYFTHNKPESISDGSNGDIACDSYHKYEEDVQWLSDIGLDFYRFSISWSRILPNGFADQVSEDGIGYYKNLIEALIAKNVTPVVSLYHWDHPQILEDLGGWTNEMMAEWFGDYARVIFEEFGPYVETFITVNEPNVLCLQGYNQTTKAPGKILENMGHYLCVHNILKAHATAYHIYDNEFRSTQNGEIGLTASCNGYVEGEGVTEESIDRLFQFSCGWITHPIFVGDYPEIMKTRIAMISELQGYPFSRLPEFSDEWIETIRGSADFFGVNHYTSVMPVIDPAEESGIYSTDSGLIDVFDETWETAYAPWLYIVPEGFGNTLRMIRDQFDNPPVYVFENGYADDGTSLNDYERISYFYEYLIELIKAVKEDGCDVRRYTIWSLLDNFEWAWGYSHHFGLVNVDFDSDERTRTAKLSVNWWKEVLQNRTLQSVPTP